MERGHAVVFGAGKMACGLLGPLLAQSGFATLFVARRPDVIDAINGRNGYSLHIAGDTPQHLAIGDCAALSARDERRVADAVADAAVVFTAVGIDNLACITPAIGAGLWRRSARPGAPPLNVIACENLPGAGAYLRQHVLSAVPPERTLTVDSVGGFSAGMTRRIMTGGTIARGELSVTIDGPGALFIDPQGLKAPLPLVQGATYTREFSVLVLRRLFTLNCAHAVAAYLGYREGCHHIHEAAVHPRVAPVLRGAVAEAQVALKAEFPHHAAAIEREAAEALAHIANARLADSVSRVARAPRRKLSLRERLVGPAHLARRHNLPHDNLCVAIAAALAYDNPADPQAVAMQEAIAAEGLDKVLTEDCGLLPHEGLARAIKQQWRRLRRDQARALAPGAGALPWTGATVEEVVQTLAGDLSHVYDPTPRVSRTCDPASWTVSRAYWAGSYSLVRWQQRAM
jgi:mannitol-1-phosphate 5-dehydrogenase